MEIREELSVAEVELLLNGVDVRIEKLVGTAFMEQPFTANHVRSSIVRIDGELYIVTQRLHIHKDQFGN